MLRRLIVPKAASIFPKYSSGVERIGITPSHPAWPRLSIYWSSEMAWFTILAAAGSKKLGQMTLLVCVPPVGNPVVKSQ